jgi:hypothetical protein
MKKKPFSRPFTIFSLLAVLSIFSIALLSFDGNSDEAATSEQNVTIAATQLNVFYTGINNPISVSVSGVKPENVFLTATGGATLTGGPGQYMITVPPGRETINITASSKKDGGGKVYGTSAFRVRNLPQPEVRFGHIKHAFAGVKELKKVSRIDASVDPSFLLENFKYTVTKYSFMLVPKNGIPTMITAKGENITPEVTKILEAVVPGDQIIVYDIRVDGPAGEILVTSSILLTIQ